MTLGNKIKNIRVENKLSQEQFADKLGISRQSVIAYEKDKTTPQTDVLITICTTFNLDLNYFVDNSNNEPTIENETTVKRNLFFDYNTYKELKEREVISRNIPVLRFIR